MIQFVPVNTSQMLRLSNKAAFPEVAFCFREMIDENQRV